MIADSRQAENRTRRREVKTKCIQIKRRSIATSERPSFVDYVFLISILCCVVIGFFVSVRAAVAILCCIAAGFCKGSGCHSLLCFATGFFVSVSATAAILWAFIAAVFGSVCG